MKNFSQIKIAYSTQEQIAQSVKETIQKKRDNEISLFCYGSLMWKPCFNYIHRFPATLCDFQRKLCIWALEYRGTKTQPGLVFGLVAEKGNCQGFIYTFSKKKYRK